MKRVRVCHASKWVAGFLAIALTTGLWSAALPGYAQGNFIRPVARTQITDPDTLGVLFPYKEDAADLAGEDGRTPVILIHGIGAEQDKNYFNWSRFLEFSDHQADFQKRFKVYLYRYDSTQSVPALSAAFQKTLRDFISNLDGRRIRILAYSEGGLLTRNALQDPVINANTERVITIATPFHGSPLANPVWLRQQLKADSMFSPVRMTNNISYWIAKKKYPSFEADFHWDNFDSAIQADQYTGRGELNGYVSAYSDKLITYGSYFGVDVDPEHTLAKELGLQAPLPKEKPRLRTPWSKHLMFSLIRRNISALPLAYLPFKKKTATPAPDGKDNLVIQGDQITSLPEEMAQEVMALAAIDTLPGGEVTPAVTTPGQKKQDLIPLMVYNDGISPISSSLWLGRYTAAFKNIKNPTARMWHALKMLKNSKQARLLPGLDHRDWMDGSTRFETNKLPDLLHPNEKPRTTFEWLMQDLMMDRPDATTTARQKPDGDIHTSRTF